MYYLPNHIAPHMFRQLPTSKELYLYDFYHMSFMNPIRTTENQVLVELQ